MSLHPETVMMLNAFQKGIEYSIEELKKIVCFDASKMHEELADRRFLYPSAVGYCEHHGGKCSDILRLIAELTRLLPESE
jgi:hypothetical protein